MTNRETAIKIIKRLHRAGFQALLAGGCVRDMLLSRPPKDYDVATDAVPDDVIKLFKRTIKIGAKFGVIMVMMGNEQVEVATFRTETGYADGRHPDNVEFSSAEEDAARRDFTINGMFYDPVARKIIDYVDGQADIQKCILRTIGKASERFGEDYLRMLRAVRFSAQLDFSIEPETYKAVCENAGNIAKISGERIAAELKATLTNPSRAKGAKLLKETGLGKAIFPEMPAEQAEFGIEVLARLRKRTDFPLALAGFFAGCEADSAIEWAGILKLSRVQTRHLGFLLAGRGKLLNVDMGIAELKKALGSAYFWDLYEFQRAIQRANRRSIGPLMKLRKRARALTDREIKPKPLLDGHELIALGARPGPMVGLLAEEMYIAQLSEELHTAGDAREWVSKWLQERRRH